MSPGISDDNKIRLGRINRNFFLHIHANKVHPHSLKTGYTFGFGIILGFLFLIMILTGVILMMNYTPSVERAYNSVKDIVFIVPGGKYVVDTQVILCVFTPIIAMTFTGCPIPEADTCILGRKQVQ